jgi:hypothetical protein
MTPALIDAVICETFDEVLAQASFEKISSRKYVRNRIRDVREVVEIHSTTVTLILTWGFSFDFVPHIAGRYTESVRWHRTSKSTYHDIWYSGRGDTIARPYPPGAEVWLNRGEARVREDLQGTKLLLLPKALVQLNAPRNLLSFRHIFEAEEEKAGKAFFNYYQLALAYAFFLARIGDAEKARKYMSAWLIRSNHREETQQRLCELFERTAARPITVQ